MANETKAEEKHDKKDVKAKASLDKPDIKKMFKVSTKSERLYLNIVIFLVLFLVLDRSILIPITAKLDALKNRIEQILMPVKV